MLRQSQVKLRCVPQNESRSALFIVIADDEPACILSINRVHGDLIAGWLPCALMFSVPGLPPFPIQSSAIAPAYGSWSV